MKRRSVVIAGLAALRLAAERSAGQQTQSKIPRVGVLAAADSDSAPAGIETRLWSMEDVVTLIDEAAERRAPRLADRWSDRERSHDG